MKNVGRLREYRLPFVLIVVSPVCVYRMESRRRERETGLQSFSKRDCAAASTESFLLGPHRQTTAIYKRLQSTKFILTKQLINMCNPKIPSNFLRGLNEVFIVARLHYFLTFPDIKCQFRKPHPDISEPQKFTILASCWVLEKRGHFCL